MELEKAHAGAVARLTQENLPLSVEGRTELNTRRSDAAVPVRPRHNHSAEDLRRPPGAAYEQLHSSHTLMSRESAAQGDDGWLGWLE